MGENIDDLLAERICQMMDNPRAMEELARAAWEAGVEDHDQQKNAQRFRASLQAKSR